jgi:hypothetical protein
MKKFFEVLSFILNPIFIIIGLYIISLFLYEFKLFEKILIAIFQLIIPLSVFFYRMYQKKIDFDLTDRKSRIPLLIFAMISYSIGSIIIYLNGNPNELKLQLGIFLLFLLFTLITVKWKISFHCFMLTIGILILYKFISSFFLLLGLILLPLVMIARVYLKKHTPMQTVAGVLLALCLLLFF